MVQDGRVDIQTKNACYRGNANKNAGRNRNQMFNVGNGSDESNQIVQRVHRTDSTPSKPNMQCYNYNEKGHYAHDCQKPKVHDAKYFKEQMLLAMKDEAGSHLSNEENDFMLDTAYGEESLDELTASVMLMARLQPADGNTVNDSSKAHEQVSHRKRKTIIQTMDDDQIDSSIIFDDPYVANNGGRSKHDSIAHEEYHEIQMLAYNVQRQSLQTIHMLGKKPNKVYDPFLKVGLGYHNPEHLKKAIVAQPKMYDGNLLHCDKLNIDSPDSEETLEDAKESVGSSHSLRRSTSKDNKSKNTILKNTKSSSTYVWKTLNSDCLDSNKCDTKTSNICQTNACISSSKTVKSCVSVVNDGSNFVCISCGNDVFLNSHEKCVARHPLSRKYSVKRALFISPLAVQSKNLGATFVVTKSRLSVAKTPTETSKVSSAITPSFNSSKTRTLSSCVNNKIATSKEWQKWFEYKQGFNSTPKSKSAQSQSSVTKSKTGVRPKTRTPIVDSGCSKHMTGNLQLLRNFIEKFMGTVRFGNDHFAAITGYNLEVAFCSNTCYVRNLEGDDFLTGCRDSNLFTISISEMAASSPVLITEYLVNISKRREFCSLNEDILKIYYSDYQYAVSIKDDTAYPCLHSPKMMVPITIHLTRKIEV
ncbi:retrovirus-related pol polyprotein from transposon TNT 1-94 [Tanacetum coccineum]